MTEMLEIILFNYERIFLNANSHFKLITYVYKISILTKKSNYFYIFSNSIALVKDMYLL